MSRILCLAAALSVASAGFAQSHHEAPPAARPAALLSGMGSHHHPIATASPEAQKFFDQGITLLYGFNHEEAYRSFARAAELDPKAAMPRWGTALALGANYNDTAPEAERLKNARAEIEKALVLAAAGPANERAYVEALAVRYPADPAADRKANESAYNEAMRKLAQAYPDDLDAATLFAESGMNLRPWKLWRPDGTPEEGTEEIVAVLESVMKRDPDHPGANHYYIHAIEASKRPERALPSARRLETLVPAAGHLVHMPAHIYSRTGDHLGAEKANAIAAEADRAYIRASGAQGMYPLMYYNHNVHFQSAAAAMAGRHAEAKKAADLLFADVLPSVDLMPAMLEGFLLQPAFVALRFRKWDDIRQMPDPGPRLPFVRANWLYARAMAAAASGDLKNAAALRERFHASRAAVPEETIAGAQNPAALFFAVAVPVLDARIAEARGDRAAAIESWTKAVEAEDAMAYDEPPGWYYPVRESLGAAYLRDGRPAEAEQVFRADLERNPRNPRSLFGLSESLRSQEKDADARWTRSQFQTAWKNADVPLRLEDL